MERAAEARNEDRFLVRRCGEMASKMDAQVGNFDPSRAESQGVYLVEFSFVVVGRAVLVDVRVEEEREARNGRGGPVGQGDLDGSGDSPEMRVERGANDVL